MFSAPVRSPLLQRDLEVLCLNNEHPTLWLMPEFDLSGRMFGEDVNGRGGVSSPTRQDDRQETVTL